MALTKPPVLPAWADAGDKVQPTDAEIQTGWPLSNVPPSRQRFNWLQNFLANGVRYLTRRGVPDYGADETYMTGDRVIGDDGKTYRSKVDDNTGNAPSTSPAEWEEWALTLASLQAMGLRAATEALTGVLRIATQAEADAGVADDRIVTPKKMRWGFSISLGANGYIVFPSWMTGLIFQWGSATVAVGGTAVNWPIAFPNACLAVFGADIGGPINTTSDGGKFASNGAPTTTGGNLSGLGAVQYFVIGH